MRTSLSEIKHIEDFLAGRLSPQEMLLMRAKLLLDPSLRQNVSMLKATYTAVQMYGRRKMKSQLTIIHQKLFTDPGKQNYREQIFKLFSNRNSNE